MIRGQKPLTFKEVSSKYSDSLEHIRDLADLNIVAEHYLTRWPQLLFRKIPIDAGLKIEECWKKLATTNRDAAYLKDIEPPVPDNYLHSTAPCPLKNQMAVLTLLGELAKRDKTSLMYVRWACGLGKTTCMIDLGHILAQASLKPTGKKQIAVRLIVANKDLVKHYQQLFIEKQR